MFNLGIHGSHNSTLVLSFQDEVLEAVEVERLISHKNAALYYYENPLHAVNIVREINEYFKKKYNFEKYDVIVINSMPEDKFPWDDVFEYEELEYCDHHVAHACCGFYQSPFQEALVVSFDGGSDEGFFNAYTIKRGEDPVKIYSGEKDYAVSYMSAGHFIRAIKTEQDIYKGNLVYPGKLMGYVGYGEYNEKYARKLTEFYKSNTYDDVPDAVCRFVKEFNFVDWQEYFTNRDGKDIATTNQIVFEQLFQEEIQPLLDKYPNLPLVLSGGCALNIINNTKLARDRELFVPPNPSDVGIALGCLLYIIRPNHQVDTTYIGSPVWDRMDLSRHLVENVQSRETTPKEVAEIILSGGIVGVVRGGSEHGPRALGNRSLLCDATNPNMKDIMNLDVKHREPWRPFSPIVRLEDVSKYFDWRKESRHMTFSPEVRPEYRELLSSVTHIDGTARVQTVTLEQNEFIYQILCQLDSMSGHGVLLNTSFNVAGKPILNTYKEAFEVLAKKPISGLVLENYYFPK
ncbi:Nol-like carbamoyltransferase [Synechococcus phage S-SCSM1]|uniref:Carbamoyl transferase n=1 Tax=Synechococcus phage S-SCSM1 TaxID=2588487 RepID=A0A6M2ZJ03_9CAUD|nr:Nol-like carbamoyltransferase [Synechococcus phage S-SCSM1]QFG06375.1 carbamoyl transferase [Synechococcus phage S-SCSM1]